MWASKVAIAMDCFITSFLFVSIIYFCLLTSFLIAVDVELDAVMRKVGSIRPRGNAAHRGAKTLRKSKDDTLRRSTLTTSSKGIQGATLPSSDVSLLSSLSWEINQDFCKVMIE